MDKIKPYLWLPIMWFGTMAFLVIGCIIESHLRDLPPFYDEYAILMGFLITLMFVMTGFRIWLETNRGT